VRRSHERGPLARRLRRGQWVALGIMIHMAIALSATAPALAQSGGQASASGPGRWELAGGGVLIGGYELGERAAELTPNTGSSGFDEFTTDNRIKPTLGLQARIGFVVTPALALEGGFRFARPIYEVRISGDVENAPDTTAEETLNQYQFDGSVVWHVTRAGFGNGQGVPYLFGGAGYLRELHEDDALVEEGLEYHAGGGIKWWFGQGRRGVGLRAEAGVSIRDGGFDFKDGQRIVPTAGGFLTYAF
jgi:hypothetical protein